MDTLIVAASCHQQYGRRRQLLPRRPLSLRVMSSEIMGEMSGFTSFISGHYPITFHGLLLLESPIYTCFYDMDMNKYKNTYLLQNRKCVRKLPSYGYEFTAVCNCGFFVFDV